MKIQYAVIEGIINFFIAVVFEQCLLKIICLFLPIERNSYFFSIFLWTTLSFFPKHSLSFNQMKRSSGTTLHPRTKGIIRCERYESCQARHRPITDYTSCILSLQIHGIKIIANMCIHTNRSVSYAHSSLMVAEGQGYLLWNEM